MTCLLIVPCYCMNSTHSQSSFIFQSNRSPYFSTLSPRRSIEEFEVLCCAFHFINYCNVCMAKKSLHRFFSQSIPVCCLKYRDLTTPIQGMVMTSSWAS